MSKSEGRGDSNPRVYGPAFPPVALFEEADSYTALKAMQGLSKLEMATILIAAGRGSFPDDFEPQADDLSFCEWAAYFADVALQAAARRAAIAEAVDDRGAQLAAGTLRTSSAPPLQLGDQAGALNRLAEVMQFLCDTHQLEAFNAWIIARQGGDVYDPVEVEKLLKNVSPAPQFKREG